jgi:bis(5'-nucleosidyl)-tetraphosphatase
MISRYPEYDRSSFGYRPMLEKHEDLLSTAISENREIIGPIDDRSLGAILIARNQGDPLALMIAQKSLSGGSPTWCFAKGHPEEGESDIDCAVREFREETGVDTCDAIIPYVFMEEAYSFVSRLHRDRWEKHAAYPDESQRPVSISHKLVRYFLAVVEEPLEISVQEAEVANAEWIPISEVISRLSHAEGIGPFKEFLESTAVQAHVSSNTNKP